MKKIIFFITAYCVLKADCGQGPKLYFQNLSSETLSVLENEFVNLTFWLNTSDCKDPSGDYRMEVETRRIDGSKEYDGKFACINNLCSVTFESSVRCTDDLGPAELFRKVNRSHAEIAVIWRWKDDVSGLLQLNERTIKLNVSYKTENGYESESRIVWITKRVFVGIVLPVAILILIVVTSICVSRRPTPRNSNATLDTEEKTNSQRTLKPKIIGKLSFKKMLRLLHLKPIMKSILFTCSRSKSVSTTVREESSSLQEGETQVV